MRMLSRASLAVIDCVPLRSTISRVNWEDCSANSPNRARIWGLTVSRGDSGGLSPSERFLARRLRVFSFAEGPERSMDRPRRSGKGPASRSVGCSLGRNYSHGYLIVTYSRRPHYSIDFPKYHLGNGCDAFPFFRWDLRRSGFSPPWRPSRSSGQRATPGLRPSTECSSIIGGLPRPDNDYPLPARGPPLSSTPASFLFSRPELLRRAPQISGRLPCRVRERA